MPDRTQKAGCQRSWTQCKYLAIVLSLAYSSPLTLPLFPRSGTDGTGEVPPTQDSLQSEAETQDPADPKLMVIGTVPPEDYYPKTQALAAVSLVPVPPTGPSTQAGPSDTSVPQISQQLVTTQSVETPRVSTLQPAAIPYQDISPDSTPRANGPPPATPSGDWSTLSAEEARIMESARREAIIEETRRKLDLEAYLAQERQQVQLQRRLAAAPPDTADHWLSRRMLDLSTPTTSSALLEQYPVQKALWADHMARRARSTSTPAHQGASTSRPPPVTPGVSNR